jgi:hypothetical protein
MYSASGQLSNTARNLDYWNQKVSKETSLWNIHETESENSTFSSTILKTNLGSYISSVMVLSHISYLIVLI